MCSSKSLSSSGYGDKRVPMDVVLVSITVVSLALAVAMGAVVLRVLRDERRRSDARVALLTAAARTRDAASESAEFEIRPEPVTTSHELFDAADEPVPWARRAAAAGVIAALVVSIGYVILPGSGSATAVAAAKPAPPLELLELGHVRDADRLVISGVVRNPGDGAAYADVSAAALLFGADGTQLATGRAALDHAALRPGQQSPFVVTVPATGAVARYRVGFRFPDGTVVEHVDRRRADGSTPQARQSGGRP
jgi:hypothetical protein